MTVDLDPEVYRAIPQRRIGWCVHHSNRLSNHVFGLATRRPVRKCEVTPTHTKYAAPGSGRATSPRSPMSSGLETRARAVTAAVCSQIVQTMTEPRLAMRCGRGQIGLTT